MVVEQDGEVNKILEIMTTNPSLRGLVRVLKYNEDEFMEESHVANLFVFSQIFPNLEKFDYIVPNKLYMNCLHRLLLDGCFPLLKVLPEPDGKSEEDAYLSCLKIIKDRVTEIKLIRDDSRNLDLYNLLRGELHLFQHLQVITIRVSSPSPCTLSDQFEFLNSLNTSIRQIYFEFDIPTQFIPTSYNDQPILFLQHLSVNCKDSTFLGFDECLTYLIKKFPNLTSLKITSPSFLAYADGYIPPSLEVTREFLNYLAKMSNYSINDFIVKQDDAKEAAKQYFVATNNSVNYWNKDEVIFHRPLDICENALMTVTKTNDSKSRKLEITYDNQRYIQNRIELLHALQNYQFEHLQFVGDPASPTLAFIERALQLFPHLIRLTFRGYAVSSTEEVIPIGQKHNLKMLYLRDFTDEYPPYIAKCFTSLHTLILCRRDIPTIDEVGIRITLNDAILTKLVLKIDLVGSHRSYSFFNLYFKIVIQNNQETSYVKLCSKYDVDEYYTSLKTCDADEYEDCITDRECICYDIVCGSVNEIVFEIGGGKQLLIYKQV